ncbi:hypothetical protein AB0K02_27695 [Streptomyces sp. NPDC049597]|uniref:hypothetical protein n=1 Tax=Streptomyces sp. NPDC049597 TaxID=3155276 RepID=UPI003413A5CE
MRLLAKSAVVAATSGALLATFGTGPATAAALYSEDYSAYTTDVGYMEGKVVFYNRSVTITGTVKSHTTGCATASFQIRRGTDEWYQEDRTACGRGPGSSKGFSFTLEWDTAGTANYVHARLLNNDRNIVNSDQVFFGG